MDERWCGKVDSQLKVIEAEQKSTTAHLKTMNGRMGAVEGSLSSMASSMVEIASQLGKKEDKKISIIPKIAQSIPGPSWLKWLVFAILSAAGTYFGTQ